MLAWMNAEALAQSASGQATYWSPVTASPLAKAKPPGTLRILWTSGSTATATRYC